MKDARPAGRAECPDMCTLQRVAPHLEPELLHPLAEGAVRGDAFIGEFILAVT